MFGNIYTYTILQILTLSQMCLVICYEQHNITNLLLL